MPDLVPEEAGGCPVTGQRGRRGKKGERAELRWETCQPVLSVVLGYRFYPERVTMTSRIGFMSVAKQVGVY